MKELIKRIPFLRSLVRKLKGIKPDESQPTFWIAKCVTKRSAQIVQIGSNDGSRGDPLHKLLLERSHWKALFVEPVPYLFERLRANYGKSPRFQFANVAINEGNPATFYWVDPSAKEQISTLPTWFDQLGSFNRDHILSHLDGVLEPFIRETTVQGMDLANLFSQEKIQSVDILHIDTEGYDWKILSQLDLDRFAPEIILYEHIHLSESDRRESVRFLEAGYELFTLEGDTLAIRKSIANRLARSLEPLKSRRKSANT